MMSSEHPLSFSQQLKAMCCVAGLPAIAIDSDFSIVWSSDAARDALPYFVAPGGLYSFFEPYNIAAIKAEIAARGSFTVAGESLFDSRRMTVCMLTDNAADGYLVLLSALPTQTDGRHPQGAMRAVNSFESQYSTQFFSLFSLLGTAARANAPDAPPELRVDAVGSIVLAEQAAFKAFRSCKWLAGYAMLSHGLIPAVPVPVELFSWLRSLLVSAAEICAQRGIPLHAQIPAESLFTKYDTGLLADILANLISNACRFTRDGNEIAVRVRPLEGRIIITVSDYGMGIPPDALPHVFEPYYSYDRGGMPFRGSGLGLAIVKNTVALLGGTVNISSTDGEGTIVAFSLPITKDNDIRLSMESDSFVYDANRFSALQIALADSLADSPAQ